MKKDINVLIQMMVIYTSCQVLDLSLIHIFRKMAENNFIEIDSETRRDINSIIHSNKFEVEDGKVIVYSQKGEELVNIDNLLSFARSIL